MKNVIIQYNERYDFIQTDAPRFIIEEQLKINNDMQKNNFVIFEPFGYIQDKGYNVYDVKGNRTSFDLKEYLEVFGYQIDLNLNYYDYV